MRMYHIHLSTIIAKSTNRLLNPNRFCVDKFQKIYLYNWFPDSTQISTSYTTSIQLVLVLTSVQSYLLKGNVLHSVPVVEGFKEAVPSWAPRGAACIARQLSSAVPLDLSMNSNTQALNPYWFSNSSQKAAPSPPSGFLTQWPNKFRTLISCTLRKVSEYRTCFQTNRLPLDVLTLSFQTL